ncbi:MAG: DUF5004 domain-containing protein [Alloprevotella sp.]|nr:DUF5004 domain-containing protein [Alloprevotella sp.]
MKKTKLLLSLFGLLLLCSACGDDEEHVTYDAQKFVGTWALHSVQGWKIDPYTGVRNNWNVTIGNTTDREYREVVFNANGTYVVNSYDADASMSWGMTENGTYTTADGSLTTKAADGLLTVSSYQFKGNELTLTERNPEADLVTVYRKK